VSVGVGVGIGVCKGCGTAGAVLASPLYNFYEALLSAFALSAFLCLYSFG
jgi:hypothetical protein